LFDKYYLLLTANRDTIKKNATNLDIAAIQAQPNQQLLLKLLGQQLVNMVVTGTTEFQTFCDGVIKHDLISRLELEALVTSTQG
jgi:hypothetical protein